ncbi:MAG: glycoside hydrolase family 78 protein [Planctomycetota bacterium]|nr:glycoside hydrolase family 78 protein [Planctomycetota bacterium]
MSWIPKSDNREQSQSAYQVLVASSPEILAGDHGDLWDSGTVKSDDTIHVPYSGKALHTQETVYWKVRAWDRTGAVSQWSEPANWTMGILHDNYEDWQAKWIAAPAQMKAATLLLRRGFSVKPGLKRAVISVCGLGQYELSINGRSVTENLLSPGWTKYNKTCLYDTYDITDSLKPGKNALGMLLGNGMYNIVGGRYTKFKGSFGPLKAIARVWFEYSDGRSELFGTDGNWKCAPGPITFSCVYGGEDYDAQLLPKAWDQAAFDDSGWADVALPNPSGWEAGGPGGKLRGLSRAAPPVRAFDVFKPAKATPLKPGVTVYDLGQNASLMPRLTVSGTPGSYVRIIPAELLHADGSVDRTSSGGGMAYWQYTLDDRDKQAYFPKFYYHGCRYLQVECANPAGSDLPVVESLEGVAVHSASEPVGEFSCSNDLFNRIHTLIRWSQLNNMESVLTDCPHRERLGWLEQDYLNGFSLRYEFNLAAFFTKVMNDMADSQGSDGLVPDIAPEYTKFSGGFRDSPEWGSAIVQVAWQQYQWDGDLRLLRANYEAMKRYVGYLNNKSQDGLLTYGLGDWYDLGPKKPGPAQLTPRSLTATAIYYSDIVDLRKIAELLGKTADAQGLKSQADKIRAAFNAKLFNPATHSYATGSQTSNAMPLALGMVDPGEAGHVLDAIVNDISNRGNSLTAGDVGYRYLLRALAQGGRSDVIFDMNNQSEKPGYGYQLKMGATSLTEAWDTHSGSQDHFMLGHINEWFYHDLAGIGSDPDSPAFKKIRIHPNVVGDLTWVKASYASVRGQISSAWLRDADKFKLEIDIPVNTTAEIYVPSGKPDDIQESGSAAKIGNGINSIRTESGAGLFEVGSGHYAFTSNLNGTSLQIPPKQ